MLILPLILPVTGGGSLILSDAKPPFVYFGRRTLSDRPFAVLPSPPAPAHCLTVVPSTSPPQPCPTLAEASLSLLFFTVVATLMLQLCHCNLKAARVDT